MRIGCRWRAGWNLFGIFENACCYYWQKEQEEMERCQEENLDA